MLGDIKSKRLIIAKGLLFLLVGLLPLVAIAVETASVKIIALALVAIWGFCRFYYFAFYVIEKYVDPSFRFSSLFAFVRYLLNR